MTWELPIALCIQERQLQPTISTNPLTCCKLLQPADGLCTMARLMLRWTVQEITQFTGRKVCLERYLLFIIQNKSKVHLRNHIACFVNIIGLCILCWRFCSLRWLFLLILNNHQTLVLVCFHGFSLLWTCNPWTNCWKKLSQKYFGPSLPISCTHYTAMLGN